MPFTGGDPNPRDSVNHEDVEVQQTHASRTEEFDDFDATAENPYNELGFGFTAYFQMLRTFICVFVAFSVIMSPAMAIYGKTDGLVVASNPRTTKARYELGNLGYSGASCISQYVELAGQSGTRQLECLAGQLGELYAFGVLPSDLDDSDPADAGWY